MLKALESALSIVVVGLGAGWVLILAVVSSEVSVDAAVTFGLGLLVVAAIFWAAFHLLRTAVARLRAGSAVG